MTRLLLLVAIILGLINIRNHYQEQGTQVHALKGVHGAVKAPDRKAQSRLTPRQEAHEKAQRPNDPDDLGTAAIQTLTIVGFVIIVRMIFRRRRQRRAFARELALAAAAPVVIARATEQRPTPDFDEDDCLTPVLRTSRYSTVVATRDNATGNVTIKKTMLVREERPLRGEK